MAEKSQESYASRKQRYLEKLGAMKMEQATKLAKLATAIEIVVATHESGDPAAIARAEAQFAGLAAEASKAFAAPVEAPPGPSLGIF